MDLGNNKRVISVEPDSNLYSQRYLSVCVLSLWLNINFMSADRKETEEAKRLITAQGQRDTEVTVPLREREQRLSLSWGRDLQPRSSSAVV